MTTEKVLDKLAKLKAMREGEAALGNTAAAEAFAAAINRLLIQHELSEMDIPLPAEQDPIVELLFKPQDFGIKFSRSRVGWQEALARIVARAHLCGFLVHSGTNLVTFVGTKAHATVAEYAFGTLAAAADRMSIKARDDYWREHRNDPDFQSGNYRAAWLTGFTSRIAERFEEAKRAEVQASGAANTALVRLNGALVRAKNYIDEKYKRHLRSTQPQSGISTGFRAGRAAADKISIGQKGLSKGSGTKQLQS